MHWQHPEHPGRRVRLAYCLNVHPAEDFEQTLAGMQRITLPLRARFARAGQAFGVGPYFPAHVAARLAGAAGAHDLDRLCAFMAEHELDPFTFNAFPFGGFHRSGLKADVFRPTWMEAQRLQFTLDVARIAVRLAQATERIAQARGVSEQARGVSTQARGGSAHVSISTHSGAFGAWMRGPADELASARNLARAALALARIEADDGLRIVLALEAEPRASAGDNAMLSAFLQRVRQAGEASLARELDVRAADLAQALARHLGTCLDTCHSAVEFETPASALALARANGPLGKLQFSSALALKSPAASESGRRELFALDEPRYLHQVACQSGARLLEVDDLPALRDGLQPDAGDAAAWERAAEWRCHFHVPVDLETLGRESALSTTREHADRVLALALAEPRAWGTDELHVEIETYTWSILPGSARGEGAFVDGLEREYAHVIAELVRAGWKES